MTTLFRRYAEFVDREVMDAPTSEPMMISMAKFFGYILGPVLGVVVVFVVLIAMGISLLVGPPCPDGFYAHRESRTRMALDPATGTMKPVVISETFCLENL